jgi:hypothetical protein
MPGPGVRRVAEMELRGSDAMRSRVMRAFVAAAMLAPYALGVGEARGDANGMAPLAQRVWVPVVNYGEPDGGDGSGIRRYARPVPVLGINLWLPMFVPNTSLPRTRLVRTPEIPSRVGSARTSTRRWNVQ